MQHMQHLSLAGRRPRRPRDQQPRESAPTTAGDVAQRGVGPTPRRFHESGVSIPSGRVTLENFLPFGRFPKTRRTLYLLLEMQLVFDFQSTPSQSG